MTEHQPDRILSGIDIPKTVAGVLAALSAAVVGSYLGVAGTLAGAAVASVIGSVGTEIYTRSIKKGHKKIQGTFTAAPAAVGTPPVAAAAATTIALPAMDASMPRKVRWKRVALVAGALFVLAMGTLTAAELISGRSIADATRGGSGDDFLHHPRQERKNRKTPRQYAERVANYGADEGVAHRAVHGTAHTATDGDADRDQRDDGPGHRQHGQPGQHRWRRRRRGCERQRRHAGTRRRDRRPALDGPGSGDPERLFARVDGP